MQKEAVKMGTALRNTLLRVALLGKALLPILLLACKQEAVTLSLSTRAPVSTHRLRASPYGFVCPPERQAPMLLCSGGH